ncbi:hypothetical protein P22_1711 [Propionispora sp. 2/2-37]|uniref:hypothetical protein n=1 Tax=Propionispora sp. 2/2-37 TaxID=1677858 RepID=UPI0006BB5928|nr:hypothetical protein [Propionispora sp. 2/2-37]CUH95637.1 hypothetical protein P22_1711 [Propionispora sp. 2/2-37]
MGETDFQREVLNRLIRMETKQDAHIETIKEHSATLASHSERITKAEESTKSAHRRIDGIFVAAGSLGAIFGTLTNIVISVWSKMGGRG